MQLLTLLLLQGLLWPLNCSCYSEHLYAAQLIGSHFGDIDMPVIYDYVIVSGETTGLVMARNQATKSSLTVAVIQVGGFHRSSHLSRTKKLQMKWPSI